MTRYAVLIQVDDSEWRYAPTETPFDNSTPPQLFDTKEEAEAAAKEWKTGKAVPYHG